MEFKQKWIRHLGNGSDSLMEEEYFIIIVAVTIFNKNAII